MAEVERILAHDALAGLLLYRIFFYTAEPATGTTQHPLDGTRYDFAKMDAYARNIQLIDQIENRPNVAVRRGSLAHQGWEIGRKALHDLTTGAKKNIEPSDIVPKLQQKGVDMRIGLDIASLARPRAHPRGAPGRPAAARARPRGRGPDRRSCGRPPARERVLVVGPERDVAAEVLEPEPRVHAREDACEHLLLGAAETPAPAPPRWLGGGAVRGGLRARGAVAGDRPNRVSRPHARSGGRRGIPRSRRAAEARWSR